MTNNKRRVRKKTCARYNELDTNTNEYKKKNGKRNPASDHEARGQSPPTVSVHRRRQRKKDNSSSFTPCPSNSAQSSSARQVRVSAANVTRRLSQRRRLQTGASQSQTTNANAHVHTGLSAPQSPSSRAYSRYPCGAPPRPAYPGDSCRYRCRCRYRSTRSWNPNQTRKQRRHSRIAPHQAP